MKSCSFVVAVLVFFSVPAFAAQIVQTLPAFETGPDGAPFTILGQSFNPGLGTLNSVTAELKGVYTARIISGGAAPATLPSNVTYTINPFNPAYRLFGIAGMQTLSGSSNLVTGAPFAIDVSGQLGNLTFFETAGPGQTPLLQFSIFSASTSGGPLPLGASSDDSSFNGSLFLTYDFTPVPEPSSLLLLASVALIAPVRTLATARRRRRSRSLPS